MSARTPPEIGVDFGGPEYARVRERMVVSGARTWRSTWPRPNGWVVLAVLCAMTTPYLLFVAHGPLANFWEFSLALVGVGVFPIVVAMLALERRRWKRWAAWNLRRNATNVSSRSGTVIAVEHEGLPAFVRGEVETGETAQPDFEVVSQAFVVETQDSWILCETPFFVVLTDSPYPWAGWTRADVGTSVVFRGAALEEVTRVPTWLRRLRRPEGRQRKLVRFASSPLRPFSCLAAAEELFRHDESRALDPLERHFSDGVSKDTAPDCAKRRGVPMLSRRARRFWATKDELRVLREAMDGIGRCLAGPPRLSFVRSPVAMVPLAIAVAVAGCLVALNLGEVSGEVIMLFVAIVAWTPSFSWMGEQLCFWLEERAATVVGEESLADTQSQLGVVQWTRNMGWPAVVWARERVGGRMDDLVQMVQPFAVRTEGEVFVVDEPHLRIRVAGGGQEDGCPGIAKAALLVHVGARVALRADRVERVPPPDWLRSGDGGYRDHLKVTRVVGSTELPIQMVVYLDSPEPAVDEDVRAESFRARLQGL